LERHYSTRPGRKGARRSAGLTQADLAHRLGISQAAVAKLERPGANPTIATLGDALRSVGQRLVLTTEPLHQGIDEDIVELGGQSIRIASSP
jgi:transcriptional regulator with XRE-family HTH domain